jgi:hypothetical protein
MFQPAQLTQEIEQVIECYDAAGMRALNPEWITEAVCDLHTDIHGKDADFWRVNGRAEVRNQVRQRLNIYKIKPELVVPEKSNFNSPAPELPLAVL